MATQAERIIAKFRKKGVTQDALADEIDTSQSTIAMWKRRGYVPVRQHQVVLDAAKKFKVNLRAADFFDGAA